MFSPAGQVIFMLCTLVFFMLSVLLVMKFFHMKPFSTWYDNIVYYIGNAITLFSVAYYFGYFAMLFGLLLEARALLVAGMVADLMCLTLACIGFTVCMSLTIFDKLCKLHKRLGERMK